MLNTGTGMSLRSCEQGGLQPESQLSFCMREVRWYITSTWKLLCTNRRFDVQPGPEVESQKLSNLNEDPVCGYPFAGMIVA